MCILFVYPLTKYNDKELVYEYYNFSKIRVPSLYILLNRLLFENHLVTRKILNLILYVAFDQ